MSELGDDGEIGYQFMPSSYTKTFKRSLNHTEQLSCLHRLAIPRPTLFLKKQLFYNLTSYFHFCYARFLFLNLKKVYAETNLITACFVISPRISFIITPPSLSDQNEQLLNYSSNSSIVYFVSAGFQISCLHKWSLLANQNFMLAVELSLMCVYVCVRI